MRRYLSKFFFLCLLLVMPLCVSCGGGVDGGGAAAPGSDGSVSDAAPKDPVSADKTVGPVHAVVRLDNRHPRLGDRIGLELVVDAESGVSVSMPEFGDQMGRFTVADYGAGESVRDDGRMEYYQRYSLELPRSGRLNTPSFLIEFTDGRPGAEHGGEAVELLTDPLVFEVGSVFGAGEVPAELYPPKGELGELVIPEGRGGVPWWVFAVIAVVVGGGLAFVMRGRRPAPVVPPDVTALGALDVLEGRGYPESPEGIDAWYVEFSDIVRRYVEGRFELHAPRMTTQELVRRAGDTGTVGAEVLAVVERILERCDRVKFAGERPGADGSYALLADARRFVVDTRRTGTEGDGND